MAYKKGSKIEAPESAKAEEVQHSLEVEAGKKTNQRKRDPAEASRRAEEMKTQGVAGLKLERLNCSLTPDNFGFIRTMSRAEGLTMTKYVNAIITEYREEFIKKYPEKYEAAIALCNIIDGVEVDE